MQEETGVRNYLQKLRESVKVSYLPFDLTKNLLTAIKLPREPRQIPAQTMSR